MEQTVTAKKEVLSRLIEEARENVLSSNVNSLKLAKEALSIASELGEKESIIQAYTIIGQSQVLSTDIDAAHISFDSAVEIGEELGDESVILHTKVYKGVAYRMQGFYSESLAILQELESKAPDPLKSTIYNNLSTIHASRGEYEDALYYNQKAIDIRVSEEDEANLAGLMTNRADLLSSLDRNDDSKAMLYEVLDILDRLGGNEFVRMFVFELLGHLDVKEEKYDDALEKFQLAETLSVEKNFSLYLPNILRKKADVYRKTGDQEQAAKYFKQALKTTYKRSRLSVLAEYHLYLREIGNLEEAYDRLQEHQKISNELFEERKSSMINAYLTKLKVVEKQREIEKLKKINELNEQLLEQNEKIKDQNEELTQFTYVITHDLKAPLRSIIGFSQLFSDNLGSEMSDDARKYLGFISDSTVKLKALIEDIYSYARLGEDGKANTEINLNQCVKEAIQHLGDQILESKAEINIEELPKVKGHFSSMVLVFQNLIHNAIRYSKENEQPNIEIKSERVGDFVRISVKDNGIGVEERFHKKVFQLFTKADNSSKEGTGVGLAICAKIIKKAGGKIWMESEPSLGTSILIDMPALD